MKAKAVSNEKSATTEKTEELAVGEVVVTVKAADGMEELEAIPVMSGEEKGSGIEIEVPMAENMSKEYFESIVVSVDFVPRQVFIFAAVEKIINVRSDQMPPFESIFSISISKGIDAKIVIEGSPFEKKERKEISIPSDEYGGGFIELNLIIK